MSIISFTLTQRALSVIGGGEGGDGDDEGEEEKTKKREQERRQQTAMNAQRVSKFSLIYLFRQSVQTQQRESGNDLHRSALPPSESLYAKPQK